LGIFSRIAERAVTVDMIVQNVAEEGLADISFTVPRNELQTTLEAVHESLKELGTGQTSQDENVSKVSAVGLGMARQSGVAKQMFAALADAQVNIQMISTSEIKISVLVERQEASAALRAVHGVFQLAEEPPKRPVAEPTPRKTADAADVADHLRDADMEELVIDDVSLDATQGRVTIIGVPDVPGVAARVFGEIASAGLFVDMIVQSHDSHTDRASLSFTVPQDQVADASDVAKRLATEYSCKGVSSSPKIAKLSVSGVGLRSHTDVAIRAFRALAAAGVNLDMISTSEVRLNIVVDGHHGATALTALQQAFADVLR
jgi:aspartate kinase